MTLAATFLVVATVVTCILVERGIAEDAALMSTFATPSLATPTSFAVGEMPDAAPIAMLIQNQSRIDDRLLGGSTPAADRVELHSSRLDHGVRKMLLTAGITIPAGGALILEPAGDHLMLVGLHDDLIQGQSLPLTLHFARAGEVSVTVRVRRKVDAAGLTPIPAVNAGGLTISLASVPPITVRRRTEDGGRRSTTKEDHPTPS